MKIVYIAHAISGDIEQNLFDLRRIVRKINLTMADVVPFVPYYVDIVSLDDNNVMERNRGIVNDTAILSSGVVNELWLTGDVISRGMYAEWDLANKLKIPVVNKTNLL